MREIPLTQGMVAMVDDEDYDLVSQYKWYARKSRGSTWYAGANIRKPDGKETVIEMQRFLMGPSPDGRTVDHRNRNGLDNQRGNLRWATQSQQCHNSGIRRHNTSGFVGVFWHKPAGAWAARIGKDRKCIRLGYFDTREEAARAYDAKAIELFGEFACLNFPSEDPRMQPAKGPSTG
jgi:hypothetical protein